MAKGLKVDALVIPGGEETEGPGAPLIRECCKELGDDPKGVRITYVLFNYTVVRPGQCIARFGRKYIDDQNKEAIKEALLNCEKPKT
jgi:hypothetical protein